MEVHFFNDRRKYLEINLLVLIILMKIEKQFVNVSFGISLLFPNNLALRLVWFFESSSIPGHHKSHIGVLEIKTLTDFGRCFLNYITVCSTIYFAFSEVFDPVRG